MFHTTHPRLTLRILLVSSQPTQHRDPTGRVAGRDGDERDDSAGAGEEDLRPVSHQRQRPRHRHRPVPSAHPNVTACPRCVERWVVFARLASTTASRGSPHGEDLGGESCVRGRERGGVVFHGEARKGEEREREAGQREGIVRERMERERKAARKRPKCVCAKSRPHTPNRVVLRPPKDGGCVGTWRRWRGGPRRALGRRTRASPPIRSALPSSCPPTHVTHALPARLFSPAPSSLPSAAFPASIPCRNHAHAEAPQTTWQESSPCDGGRRGAGRAKHGRLPLKDHSFPASQRLHHPLAPRHANPRQRIVRARAAATHGRVRGCCQGRYAARCKHPSSISHPTSPRIHPSSSSRIRHPRAMLCTAARRVRRARSEE
eukprot:3937064-Rhodomonas_salina.4